MLQAAPTPSHGSLIPIYAAHITQVVAVQLSIQLGIDARALKGVDLFTGHRAVLLQDLCISLPSHLEGMRCDAARSLEEHLQQPCQV